MYDVNTLFSTEIKSGPTDWLTRNPLVGLQNLSEEGLISETVLCFQRSGHRNLAETCCEAVRCEINRVEEKKRMHICIFLSKTSKNCVYVQNRI